MSYNKNIDALLEALLFTQKWRLLSNPGDDDNMTFDSIADANVFPTLNPSLRLTARPCVGADVISTSYNLDFSSYSRYLPVVHSSRRKSSIFLASVSDDNDLLTQHCPLHARNDLTVREKKRMKLQAKMKAKARVRRRTKSRCKRGTKVKHKGKGKCRSRTHGRTLTKSSSRRQSLHRRRTSMNRRSLPTRSLNFTIGAPVISSINTITYASPMDFNLNTTLVVDTITSKSHEHSRRRRGERFFFLLPPKHILSRTKFLTLLSKKSPLVEAIVEALCIKVAVPPKDSKGIS